MIPPKRFDIFPPDWMMLSLDAFRFFFRNMKSGSIPPPTLLVRSKKNNTHYKGADDDQKGYHVTHLHDICIFVQYQTLQVNNITDLTQLLL